MKKLNSWKPSHSFYIGYLVIFFSIEIQFKSGFELSDGLSKRSFRYIYLILELVVLVYFKVYCLERFHALRLTSCKVALQKFSLSYIIWLSIRGIVLHRGQIAICYLTYNVKIWFFTIVPWNVEELVVGTILLKSVTFIATAINLLNAANRHSSAEIVFHEWFSDKRLQNIEINKIRQNQR